MTGDAGDGWTMERLADVQDPLFGDKIVWIERLAESAEWNEVPFAGQVYAALVVNTMGDLQPAWRRTIAENLIRSNCRYVVCAGVACEALHDEVDSAYLRAQPGFQPRDETFVMTTWHARESIEDIVNFFLQCTGVGGLERNRRLMLFLGASPEVERRYRDAMRVADDE